MDLPAGRFARTYRRTPLKADPFAQLKLLDVQELDSRTDALEHRLRSLPETARIAEVSVTRKGIDDRARDLRVRVADLTAEQRKADADVEQVRSRRERDRSRMGQGLITNPKDLERMGHELESLERRISSLEDVELEVMEQLEEAQTQLDEATGQLAELDAEIGVLTSERDVKAGDVGREREQAVAERGVAVQGLPEDLLALYERLRTNKGGVGAAALRARQCGGCMLTLDSAVLAQIKARPTDDVVRCEECDRILVRTGESGL